MKRTWNKLFKNKHSRASISSPPPPIVKRVGRPIKLYTSDQVRDMIVKCDKFHTMVDFSKKYDQLFEIHCKWSVPLIVRLPTETLRLFTQKKEEEVRFHDSIKGNYCETARAFNINESTVWEMMDAHPLPDKKKLSSKCNFPGAGRPLTYSIERDNKLIHFFQGICIFQLQLWVFKRKQSLRYNITTRPLMQVEVGLESFPIETNSTYPSFDQLKTVKASGRCSKQIPWRCGTFYENWKVSNTSVFWHSFIKMYFEKRREGVCCSFLREWKKSSATAGGQMFPTIIIFKVKTEQTICNLNIPPVFIVKTHGAFDSWT